MTCPGQQNREDMAHVTYPGNHFHTKGRSGLTDPFVILGLDNSPKSPYTNHSYYKLVLRGYDESQTCPASVTGRRTQSRV